MSIHPGTEDGNGSGSAPWAPSVANFHTPSGDRSADALSFEALFREYFAPLCAFARRYVQCPYVAEELVDDVFVQVWERRSSWQVCVNQRRYLYAAVRNQALKHLAHERVVKTLHEKAKHKGYSPGMGQSPTLADELLNERELVAALRKVIDQLPARCHQAFTLRRNWHMSYEEIATVMGTSVRTVETQVGRARRICRRALVAWLT